MKFLKPHAVSVVAIVAVLILQAYCDLSLPSYTSDIVNVGIQQAESVNAIRKDFKSRYGKSVSFYDERRYRDSKEGV